MEHDFSGEVDEAKNAVVYQRYCHVYVQGELDGLFSREKSVELSEACEVEAAYMDTGNWCVRVRKK